MGAGTGIINALVLSWLCVAWHGMALRCMAWHCTGLYCDTLNNNRPNQTVWRYAALEMRLERLVGWLVRNLRCLPNS